MNDWRGFAEIGRVLQDNARRARTRAIPFLHSCPEMRRFLATFSTVAWQDAPGLAPEWNPFTQRILLRSRPRNVSQLGADFETLEYAVTGAMHMVHEACHVLTWEPLFVGALPTFDADTFVATSMGFEGFCFWYPDIVVARQMRDRYPNGDVVLSRRGASSPHFSPHLAFDALGIRSTDEIRHLYIDAFSGLGTPLTSPAGMKHAASRSLARRIYGFYGNGKIDIAAMHEELARVDLFGEFARRFWLAGLPSVLPAELLARTAAAALSLTEYCDELVATGFPAITSLDGSAVRAVAFRRGVQTRAYFAWTLRHMLRAGDFVGGAGPAEAIAGRLDGYLGRLEDVLHDLRDSGALQSAAVADADRRYQRDVRGPLRRARLWLSRRRQIFPGDPAGFPWGATPPARRSRQALARCLELARGLVAAGEPVPAALAEICRLPRAAADRRHWNHAHDRFMRDPAVLPRWSVPLWESDPESGAFRELLFVYH